MASPADEIPEPHFRPIQPDRSSDEDGTAVESNENDTGNGHRLAIDTSHLQEPEESFRSRKTPSQNRADAHRLDDDLRLLQVERQVSKDFEDGKSGVSKTAAESVRRERSKREEVADEFDIGTNPLHERTALYKPPEHPATRISKLMKRVHNSSFLVRYFTYITPVVLILLIPLLIGALLPAANGKNGPEGDFGSTVGGVSLLWFMIWLEIVWLTLWLGRIIALLLPYPVGIIASLFTNNSKKWKDMMKQLELAATLWFWWLAIEISFLPTMIHHQEPQYGHSVQSWQSNMNKVLISFLVLASLNLIEKIIIQLIAISFHLRTYQDRIELNKFQIGSLTKLYTYSKVKLQVEDSDFETASGNGQGPASGARTPAAIFEKAHKQTRKAVEHFGDAAGKIAGDFTGKAVTKSSHPSQVTLALLSTTGGSQVLARRLYRTLAREDTETIHQEDLTAAFENEEECEAAFQMFDKDMNGDISMEELEAVCVEIGRERKAITASLKDLDSVVSKLDDVFMFAVFVISALVLISLISNSAAAGLSSAGSVVLGLSWLFSVTASEFLQSTIFVFVKHPYDVGDRVTIYGNTGASLTGDDYFVKEISLLYTEFKKMEGHVVQAPNSYLNTLFILNQRRSGGLAEAVPVVIKFGTTLEQIDGLRQKLLEFVTAENREFKANILTELRDVYEAHSITLNVVFFFKSNWQNELLRLQRRNKFLCALMISMQELGIEGPRMRYPGQKDSYPVYLQNVPWSAEHVNRGNKPDETSNEPAMPQWSNIPPKPETSTERFPSFSTSRSTRQRGESMAQMGRRLDFSLGMSSLVSGDFTGDVYEDTKPRVPAAVRAQTPSTERRTSKASRVSEDRFARPTGRSSTVVGPAPLQRVSTDGGPRHSGSIHRNRFFPRRSHDVDRMEAGMAGIPEADTPGGPMHPIDPRTGMISPMAIQEIRDNSTSRQRPSSDRHSHQGQSFEMRHVST